MVSAVTSEEAELLIASLKEGITKLSTEYQKLDGELKDAKAQLNKQNEELEKSKMTFKITLGVAALTTVGAFFLAQRMSAKS